MAWILDALSTLALAEDRVLWAIVALVVGYLVLGVVVARGPRSGRS